MNLIRSMEDLARAEDEAMERQRISAMKVRFHIRVAMSSCSLAAGAGDTFDALHRLITEENLTEVDLSLIGCNGLCALEPIVQVLEKNRPQVTYGKVTPDIAQRIIQRHIKKGQIVQESVIENI
jgi:NADP-reducing hydrogenase subunit HndB